MGNQKGRVDLCLAGIGLRGMRQMTREVESALRSSRIVFHYGEPHGALRKLCRRVVDLSDEYWTGEDREVVYQRLARRVMEEVRRGPGVVSVTYGHPTLFDDVHMSLVRRCRREGFRLQILPGVSCLDTICLDLMIDYGDPGLIVFEATDLVLNRRRMNPELHTLLMQVGSFGVDETTDTIEDTDGMFEELDRYLRKFYPAGHSMKICYSDDGRGAVKFSTSVGRLDACGHRIFPGTTLYIPPL